LAPELLREGTVQVLLEQIDERVAQLGEYPRLKPLGLFSVYMVTVANRAKDNK
jgi:hypothetical protein